MCLFGIKLLEMKSRKDALEFYKGMDKKPVFAAYIESELLQLSW